MQNPIVDAEKPMVSLGHGSEEYLIKARKSSIPSVSRNAPQGGPTFNYFPLLLQMSDFGVLDQSLFPPSLAHTCDSTSSSPGPALTKFYILCYLPAYWTPSPSRLFTSRITFRRKHGYQSPLTKDMQLLSAYMNRAETIIRKI